MVTHCSRSYSCGEIDIFALPTQNFPFKKNSDKAENHAISEQMSSLVPLRLPFSVSTVFFPSETPIKNEALKNINKSVLGLGLLCLCTCVCNNSKFYFSFFLMYVVCLHKDRTFSSLVALCYLPKDWWMSVFCFSIPYTNCERLN